MSEKKPTERPYDICGAKTKSRDGVCQLRAGWGTDHLGEGKCKLHGGASTGPPKGNKNARKHGAYEAVTRDQLSEEEREIYDQVDDARTLDGELRILRFKLLRLLDPPQREIYDKELKEIIQLDVDEMSKVTGITRLADQIRRIVKQSAKEQDRSATDPESYLNALREDLDGIWDKDA